MLTDEEYNDSTFFFDRSEKINRVTVQKDKIYISHEYDLWHSKLISYRKGRMSKRNKDIQNIITGFM